MCSMMWNPFLSVFSFRPGGWVVCDARRQAPSEEDLLEMIGSLGSRAYRTRKHGLASPEIS